jgi:hypothetical protein
MDDKRKIKRRYLLYYTRVYDASKQEQIGNLVDITPKGAMILGPDPLPEGQSLCLRIELSEDVSNKPHIELPAYVKWCHPDLDPSQYDIGFEFAEISPEDVAIIENIINTYGFRDNEPNISSATTQE